MRTINLTIEKQTLTLDSLESLPVQGSDNSVKLAFAFDNSWESYPTRRAYFQYYFSNWKYVELSADNDVLVPREFLAKPGFKVMIRGYAQSGAIMATNIENVPVEFAPSLADSTAVVPVAIRSGDDAISVEQEGDVVTISLNDEFESNKFVSEYTISGTAQDEIIFLNGVLLGTTEKSFADFKSIYNQIVIPYEFTIGSTNYHDTLVATETRYNDQNAYYIADLLPLGQNYTAIVTIHLDETSVKAVIACLPFTLNNSFDSAPTSGSTKLVNSGAVYSALESAKALLEAYSDANLATAKSYADGLLVEGKQYTDNKYNSLVGIITHETEVMEARITSAITQMQNQVNASITGMETTIQGELTTLDQRVDEAISTMNTTISSSLTNMENTIQQELANLDTRFSTLQTALEARITTLSNQIDSQFSTLQTQLEGRIDTLEGEVDTKLSEADEAIAILNGYNERLTKVEGTYVTKIELYEALKRGEISSEVEKAYTSEINYITDNLMPSGKVTKILGKTEKSENLIVLENTQSTTISGVTYKILNGTIPLNGTATANGNVSFGSITLKKGITYYLTDFNLKSDNSVYWNFHDSSFANYFILNYSNKYKVITPNEDMTLFIHLYFTQSYSGNWVLYPMLVQGSTAPTTWSQGYEGLKHTHITGLKTTQINLFNEKMVLGTLDVATGNVISISDRLVSEDFIDVLPNQDIYFRRGETATNMRLCYYDINHNFIKGEADGTPMNRAYTTPSLCHYIKFGLQAPYGTTYKKDICINKSDSTINGNYYPYEQDTLDIEFEGNGVGTASDELDVEEKKHYQRFDKVNLEDYDWTYESNLENPRFFSTTSLVNATPSYQAESVVLISSIYKQSYTTWADNSEDLTIGIYSNGRIYIRDLSCPDVATLKAKLVGKSLVYKLAEPIVTDIVIPNDGWIDNLIQGGSITQQVDTTDTSALIAKEVDIAVNVVVDNQ